MDGQHSVRHLLRCQGAVILDPPEDTANDGRRGEMNGKLRIRSRSCLHDSSASEILYQNADVSLLKIQRTHIAQQQCKPIIIPVKIGKRFHKGIPFGCTRRLGHASLNRQDLLHTFLEPVILVLIVQVEGGSVDVSCFCITDDEMLPATLTPEIMTGLLRDELGFNGVVISDATHMVAMTSRMKHADMEVQAINAGNDMYLFFNDPEEDFNVMLDAYRTGKITEERMTEALTRILGLKAKMGLNKKAKEDIVPQPDALSIVGQQAYKDMAAEIADKSITLVKYKDEGVLPVTPEKYPRIMIVYVKGADGPMAELMKFAFGTGVAKATPATILRDKLIEKGFDAYIYESPIDKMKRLKAEGKEVGFLDVYHAGKASIEDFKSDKDLVITLMDVQTGRPVFGTSKGGGEIPWYVHDMTTIGISVNQPTMLADVPMLRTYINAYDSKPYTMDALVEKLMAGPDAFTGVDPIDSFCGLWDTRI